LKTTANALVGCIALAMIITTSTAVAGPLGDAPENWLGSVLLGQSSTADSPAAKNTAPKNKGKQVADLLRRARQAMAENDLSTAESLVSQAEGLGVTYNVFYMGDTPKKVRRDLQRKQEADAAPHKPSQLFAPLGLLKGNKKSPSKDPFAGRSTSAPVAKSDAPQVTPLPNVDTSNQVRSMAAQGASPMQPFASQPYSTTQPGVNDARLPGSSVPAKAAPASNESPLRKARLALAVGDVRRVAGLIQKAKAAPVDYQPLDDTPEKVESTLRKYQELSGIDEGTEAYARLYARNLMEQASALMRWGEYDEAERLADRASGIRITYGPFEQKPQVLLKQIADARRQKNGRAPTASLSTPGYASASAPTSMMAARKNAVELVRQAREAIASNQLDRAEMLARQAGQLRLPNTAFAPGEDRPGLVLLDIRQLRERGTSGVVPAGDRYVVSAGGSGEPNHTAERALYNPARDQTENRRVSNQQSTYRFDGRFAQSQGQPTPAYPPASNSGADAAANTPGMALFQQGEAALKAHDAARARELFSQAANYTNEMDPVTVQRLQDHLQLLAAPSRGPSQPAARAPTMADEAASRQRLLTRQVAADLAHRESNARALRENDPKGALVMLQEARKKVEASGLDTSTRDQLLRRVDRAIAETDQIIEQNRPQLELAERNDNVRQEIAREQRVKLEVQEKLALLIDDFNRLMDEERFEEAQVVAKRAAELDPTNPVVTQVLWQAKFVRRFHANKDIESQAEEGFVNSMLDVDRAKVPMVGDQYPMVFPNDGKDWGAFSDRRRKYSGDHKRARSEREIEIEKRLRTPVTLQFTNAPLSNVLDYLAKLAEVNLYIDPQGLAEEGVSTDTPVTIELRSEIMLKSALNLILQPLHLSYVIKDEVLKITSEQMRDGEVFTTTYNVAHLVIPIPNFVPTSMGIDAAYKGAMANVGFGGSVPFGSPSSTTTPLAVVANHTGQSSGATINPDLLAQQMSGGPGGMMGGGAGNVPIGGAGPGGLGGGAQADFDSLIDLITSTVKPTTWDEVGGPGSIAPFETNLSIVVSQTQDVHEEIVDLLEQLRRLQDLQVTIEVRFITLNDNFFERIGVDFDFTINDDAEDVVTVVTGTSSGDDDDDDTTTTDTITSVKSGGRTVVVGQSSDGVFSSDLDIPFAQNSYGLAVPQFGGFDASAGASLGFAILSDIEAYFFITAAQGDKRSNVLQAPKVTLFNGQQAYISDTSQSPFVISVIPVVGDFAAAQQPVIVVLSEGTFMTVQAVISNDRRFVRLTVVPFFSSIGEVNTFQFTGSTTTTTDSTRSGLFAAATDADKLWNDTSDSVSVASSGTTVQLPTFSYVTVTTTVSVPDGGTVLLGGIKRLSEGRSEFGVPLLNKLPYVNRLFKNVGIGRETQSLMMMVTPRIIIQEEEEEKLGILSPP